MLVNFTAKAMFPLQQASLTYMHALVTYVDMLFLSVMHWYYAAAVIAITCTF